MKAINQIGVPTAQTLMVTKLSFVNYKSFVYLYTYLGVIGVVEQIFSIIGAVVFSMVTVLAMQNEVVKWPKLVFPFFDAGLVFISFNINHYQALFNGTDNPFRFALTIFMSVFAGLITYSLGLIRYESGLSKDELQAEEYKLKWYSANKELESLKGNTKSVQSEAESHKTELSSLNSKLASLEAELKTKQSDISKMHPIFLSAEVSRIKKKKEANRTAEEIAILAECN